MKTHLKPIIGIFSQHPHLNICNRKIKMTYLSTASRNQNQGKGEKVQLKKRAQIMAVECGVFWIVCVVPGVDRSIKQAAVLFIKKYYKHTNFFCVQHEISIELNCAKNCCFLQILSK